MANCKIEHEFGCGFMGGILHRRGFWQRKATIPALPASEDKKNAEENHKQSPRKQQGNSADCSINVSAKPPTRKDQNLTKDSAVVPPSPRTSTSHPRNQGRRPSDAARSSTSSSSSSGQSKALQIRETGDDRSKPAKSSESKALVRASSGNIVALGNLKTSGTGNSPRNSFPSPTMKNLAKVGNNAVMGNILRHPSDEFRQFRSQLKNIDPEVLKTKGNEAYKQGKFEEALEFYDRAIGLDPKNATFRSNKSAALVGLGCLSEAVSESREAIRIDPTYYRAHHRLATLYLRW